MRYKKNNTIKNPKKINTEESTTYRKIRAIADIELITKQKQKKHIERNKTQMQVR